MVSENAAVEPNHVRPKLNTSERFVIPLNVCPSTKCIRMELPGVHWTTAATDQLNRRNENDWFSPFPGICA